MLYLLRAWAQERQGILARQLLAYGLRKEYGIYELPRIEKQDQGKPYFPELPQIFFNYSHCRQGILCGLHTSEIGVDMERIIPYKERLARRLCHPGELALLAQAEKKDELMTRIWTCKESALKYLGCGIRSDLRLLDCSAWLTGGWKSAGSSFVLSKDQKASEAVHPGLRGSSIYSRVTSCYGLAICCKGTSPKLVEISQKELF